MKTKIFINLHLIKFLLNFSNNFWKGNCSIARFIISKVKSYSYAYS